jgi:hypothetical protein
MVALPAERLQVLTVRECLEHLRSRDLGRLAFQVDGDVEILPINYAIDGRVVVFRTASLTRLQRSLRARVTFEVDSWDLVAEVGWSVVLKGVARDVTDGTDPFSIALRRGGVVPLAPGKREQWIAIYPSAITGRRFRVSAR